VNPRDRRRSQRASASAQTTIAGHELHAQPRQQADEQRGARGTAQVRRAAHAQGEERRAGDRGGGDRLGAHRRRPGERGRRQPERERRPGRPGVGDELAAQGGGGDEAQREQRRDQQLGALGPGDRVGGRQQQRQADAGRLVQAPVGQRGHRRERLGRPLGRDLVAVLVAAGRRRRSLTIDSTAMSTRASPGA
jgi:hypothetical protein